STFSTTVRRISFWTESKHWARKSPAPCTCYGDYRILRHNKGARFGRTMATMWTVSDFIAQLEPDHWRQTECPFSEDMEKCHEQLFRAETSRAEKANVLAKWLSDNQPCLFGQMEAKQNRLAFCILTDNDLERSDDELRHRIHRERTDWKHVAAGGGSHGFLIV